MSDHGLVVGTAGHVDHGKTAIVEALTGTNVDRLDEERRRGISIELGFAELQLGDGDGGLTVGLVDVPGHERLVRTMVAGASGIDLFLMAVAADDGVMPQTHEHWIVLRTLGVERGVIAVSKCDLVGDEERALVAEEVSELMPGHPIVEVSARTGEGIPRLRSTLASLAADAAAAAPRPGDGSWPEPAVMHVDRAFSIHGAGTVVTGTLWSGELAAGEHVDVLPLGARARIRAIQAHGRDISRVAAGRRVALNLVGIERTAIARGDVVTSAAAGVTPTYRLDCLLSVEGGITRLDGERVQVHHGTRDAPARVVALDEDGAQLRLERPLLAREGDRIVLRRIARPETIGGGHVVDANPRRHAADRGRGLLALIRDGEPEELIRAGIAEAGGDLPRSPGDWSGLPALGAARTRFTPQRWQLAIEQLVERGEAAVRKGRIVPASEPEAKLARDQGTESAQGALGATAARALDLLVADGSRPRAPKDLAEAMGTSRDDALAALDELHALGEAVRLKPTIYYPRTVLSTLESSALELARERGSISLGELRDALGLTRKYAQAILEHLDGEKHLVRRGDRHYPRRHGAGGAAR